MPNLIIDGERWLIMGAPKSGKSSFCNTFPEPLVIDLDGAANKYAYDDSERIICRNIKDVRKAVSSLNSYEYLTVVLDPLDRLVLWISQEICKKGGQESIGDFAYNKGRDRVDARVIAFIDDFWNAAENNDNLKASILVAHTRSSDDVKCLVVPKNVSSWLTSVVNNISFAFKRKSSEGVEYSIDLNGSNIAEAGCRNPTLNAAGSVSNDYDEIVELFRPDKKTVSKLLAWLEKEGGIPRKLFLAFCEEDGKDDVIDVYARLQKIKKRPKLLAKYRKRMEKYE